MSLLAILLVNPKLISVSSSSLAAIMDKLTKYGSDEENIESATVENNGDNGDKIANLESEWESFEKMIAGGGDDDVTESAETAASAVETSISTSNHEPSTAPPTVYNPYAYLSQYTQNDAISNGQSSIDMEQQLEMFLEQTAKAASEAAKTSDEGDGKSEHNTDSPHTGSDSGDESDASGHSASHSGGEEAKEDSTSVQDKQPLGELEKQSTSKDTESRKPSTSHRSRSYRSRSRSRRSRSRSKSRRHRRRRSSSRSRHGGSRRRRRSGSRHRRRGHRSRSPRRRHENSRHRSGRHRRSRHRSNSRDRHPARRPQFAPQPKAPVQEDFKTRMKRELQQAAKEALAGKAQATPQQALLQTMAAMHAKAQELTGVEIPKFYNPAAINPLKFAEQQQKRKLLWSKAGENNEKSLQKFQGTDVVADEKYRKLMGIKGEVVVGEQSEEQLQRQNELFAKLDQEYAMARLTTHTHRGMGLGVVSSMAAASANEQFNKP